jgi:hypothetical protein
MAQGGGCPEGGRQAGHARGEQHTPATWRRGGSTNQEPTPLGWRASPGEPFTRKPSPAPRAASALPTPYRERAVKRSRWARIPGDTGAGDHRTPAKGGRRGAVPHPAPGTADPLKRARDKNLHSLWRASVSGGVRLLVAVALSVPKRLREYCSWPSCGLPRRRACAFPRSPAAPQFGSVPSRDGPVRLPRPPGLCSACLRLPGRTRRPRWPRLDPPHAHHGAQAIAAKSYTHRC